MELTSWLLHWILCKYLPLPKQIMMNFEQPSQNADIYWIWKVIIQLVHTQSLQQLLNMFPNDLLLFLCVDVINSYKPIGQSFLTCKIQPSTIQTNLYTSPNVPQWTKTSVRLKVTDETVCIKQIFTNLKRFTTLRWARA